MKDFCLALIISMLLIVAALYGHSVYRVYFAQPVDGDACPVNYDPIRP